MPSLFFCVHYSITDGDCEYGTDCIAEIQNGSFLSQEDVRKLLLKECVASEFGEPDEIEIDKEDLNRVWEIGHCRRGELENYFTIPENDYEVMKKYILSYTITPENKAFVFR